MDIKDFDIKYIQEFSIFYHLIKSKFGKIVESDNIKRQNKIKKWMFKKCISEEYPKNIVDCLNTLNAKEFITFFKSCDEYISLYGDALTQQINKTCNNLPESVKDSFCHLFDNEFYVGNDFKLSNDGLEITVVSAASYEEKLILYNAKYSTDKKFDTYYFNENCSLTEENGIYKLTGEASLFDDEEEYKLSITFTSAKTEIVILNPTNSYLDSSPWEQLLHISLSILDKKDFEKAFNESEIKLLPLLKEIKSLLFAFDESEVTVPIFENLVKKHGFHELLSIIEKIKAKNISDKRKTLITAQLIIKLNLIKYKPLWQEIFDSISESQKDYPFEIITKKSKGSITKFKNEVTNIMQECGFDGVYPDYYKKSSIKGIHFFESYNMSYAIVKEKTPCITFIVKIL